jgi:hypothetical protein
MVWEAAADELFLRYLGRDLGIELPAAREALAQALENSGGNYLEAERTVLKSIFYRQRARVLTADQPQYLSGPTKRMLPEVWLHSAAEFVGSDAGDCDFRAPSAAATERDRWFSETARAMGGCPGTREPGSPAVRARKSELGLDTAVAEDQAVVTLCYELDVPALIPAGVSRDATDAAALRATAAHVLERAYATPAEGAELDHLLASAAEQCADCDAEQLARDLCTAVIGGIDYVAY